ncbi:MAG TPA: RluA family pseudouridine synthase [Candidatus Saccharimonadales bacterium]|nr:RluA family pseudouridine synthase [Candidatus Saccharimonadales bacterium]
MTDIVIPAAAAGERLDVALAAATGKSRSQITKLIKEDKIFVDDRLVTGSQLATGGERVRMAKIEQADLPEVPNLPIIFEDKDLLVIDKPAGLVVHLTETGRPQPTVADFASTKVKDDDLERPGIVHRLDRDTSGVLVIAKNPEAKKWLQKQFHDRKVEKHYIALVSGHLREGEATINLPIGRSRKQPTKRAVTPGARSSITKYRVKRELPGVSLLDVELETGRTHQIRVHFAHLGHPVIGDNLYGSAEPKLGRFFLHAASLTLTSPSGRQMTFSSPLPTELKTYLADLEGYNR